MDSQLVASMKVYWIPIRIEMNRITPAILEICLDVRRALCRWYICAMCNATHIHTQRDSLQIFRYIIIIFILITYCLRYCVCLCNPFLFSSFTMCKWHSKRIHWWNKSPHIQLCESFNCFKMTHFDIIHVYTHTHIHIFHSIASNPLTIETTVI